jgi:general secretion pathway protein D
VSKVDITTAKRTISTNVLIEDGGVVVLGGLISNSSTKGEQRVPYLGSIPLIGMLFKTRQGDAGKSNLMIFIRPKILRDATQTAFETDSKYNYMIDQQKQYNRPEILPMIPGGKKPMLPPAPPPPRPGSTEQGAVSPDEKARQARKQAEAEKAHKQQPGKPNASQPPPPYVPPPDSTTTHPEGEPPYATEPPGVGVLIPPTTPPAPPPTTPPEGGKP